MSQEQRQTNILFLISGQDLPFEYVHVNMKTRLLRFWARISRKLARKPQQLELNLWTRRSTR
jgi:hypothetical protein